MKRIEMDFPEALEVLKVMKKGKIDLCRLNDIYNYTEVKWEENIQRYIAHGTEIQYLLVGEAAPASEGEVSYFYNKCETSWCRRVTSTFFDNHCPPRRLETEGQLDGLASYGFALIDILPFAVKYSSQERDSVYYMNMIRLCAKGYFLKHINDPRLKWGKDVKVAFAVPKTCTAAKHALGGGFTLPNNQKIEISPALIGTDGTNYPSGKVLRRIFGIDDE